MVFNKILSIPMASISSVALLIALTTNYWLVAYGPTGTSHSGLWQECMELNTIEDCRMPTKVQEYIRVTRVLLILGSVAALALVICLMASLMPWNCGFLGGAFVTAFVAFTGALFTLVGVVIFFVETWQKNKDHKVQLSFEWSFYLAWVAAVTLLLTGIFSIVVRLCFSRAGYENM